MQLWYIDEAGINSSERYIVVGGFCIDDDEYGTVLKKFVKFKQDNLPDPTRKIDMKSLVRGKGWWQTIPLPKRKEFLKNFYSFLGEINPRIVISMVDRDNSSKIRQKLHFAYECLFERICLNMERNLRSRPIRAGNRNDGFHSTVMPCANSFSASIEITSRIN